MAVSITRPVLCAILDAAARAAPSEACGFLLGLGRRVTEARETANVAPDPAAHFEIDPAALIAAHKAARTGGAQVVGYWHSHPNGREGPSEVDRASASGDGRIWVIAANGAITVWSDEPHGFEALSYDVDDG